MDFIDGFVLDLYWVYDGFMICMGQNLSTLRLSEVI